VNRPRPASSEGVTQPGSGVAEAEVMTTKSSSALAFASLLAQLVCLGTSAGCSVFDANEPSAPAASEPAHDSSNGTPGTVVDAPAVGGPASTTELTDALGIFVSPSGRDDAAGTHLRPLATIQAGIEMGKRAGKRVYVCTGTYKESLTLADSVSVIGGLDCTANEWRTGGPRTRIESPTSPAIRATNITAPTRIEGLEVLAPDATTASGSSFALIADHASALVIASSKLVAGNAIKGDDGGDGVQLANSATVDGAPALAAGTCTYFTCNTSPNGFVSTGLVPAGTNLCPGAPGHEAQPGGAGGSGGVWETLNDVSAWHFHVYPSGAYNSASTGITNRTGAVGTNGGDGANAPALGAFSADGYVAPSGTAGADGTNGLGGAGGSGTTPEVDLDPNTAAAHTAYRGPRGASGGAGGCAGLAGAPGQGGGASITVLALESAIKIEGSELVSSHGGDAGLGALGSLPTAGGAADNTAVASHPTLFGKPGGHGGAAGVSGNGATGPSLGIAYVGAKPDVRPDTTITPGPGGSAIDTRTQTAFGITKSIPATPAGLSQAIVAL
jgi:hypothetical protein